MLVKPKIIIAFTLLTSMAYAQKAYKGGKADGYAMVGLNNFVISPSVETGDKLVVYPNPALKGEELQFSKESNGSVVSLLSEYGGLIQRLEIDNLHNQRIIAPSQSGFYLITLRKDNQVWHAKLIVK